MKNKIGLIWSENGNVEVVVPKAMKRFVERFGVRPALVEVNHTRVPESTQGGEMMIEGVRVVGVKFLMKNDCFVSKGG